MTYFAVSAFAKRVQCRSERALLVRKRRQYQEQHARQEVPIFAVSYVSLSVISKTELQGFLVFVSPNASLEDILRRLRKIKDTPTLKHSGRYCSLINDSPH